MFRVFCNDQSLRSLFSFSSPLLIVNVVGSLASTGCRNCYSWAFYAIYGHIRSDGAAFLWEFEATYSATSTVLALTQAFSRQSPNQTFTLPIAPIPSTFQPVRRIAPGATTRGPCNPYFCCDLINSKAKLTESLGLTVYLASTSLPPLAKI